MPSTESPTPDPQLKTLMTGLVFGESPRWGDDGRLWLADWGAQEILAVDLDGQTEVTVRPIPKNAEFASCRTLAVIAMSLSIARAI